MDEQNRNLILAVVLSALVFLGWYAIFPPPEAAPSPEPGTEVAQTAPDAVAAPDAGEPGAAAADAAEDRPAWAARRRPRRPASPSTLPR